MKAALYPVLGVMLSFWVISGTAAVHAQESPKPPKIEPGYESLVTAVQLVQSSRALDTAAEPGATLTQKRLALSDKPVVQALDLLRRWLDAHTVPSAGPEWSGESLLPVLSGVRALGRALVVRNYVLLADGRVSDAIDSLRDGLRLSYAISNSTMAGWLNGVVVKGMMTESLAPHLDQLSARDCDHLLRLAQDWVSTSDPLPNVLERLRLARLALARNLGTEEGLHSVIQELYASGDGLDPAGTQLAAQMERMTPQAMQQVMERVTAHIDATHEQALRALRMPYWKRTPSVAPREQAQPPDDPLVKQLVSRMISETYFDRATDRYTQAQAIERLLGCHAAIRRYRWEHDSLPLSLAALKIGDMAIDPFTGKPFLYKIEGADYTLESVGPLARDDKGYPLPDRHSPVTLTPGK